MSDRGKPVSQAEIARRLEMLVREGLARRFEEMASLVETKRRSVSHSSEFDDRLLSEYNAWLHAARLARRGKLAKGVKP